MGTVTLQCSHDVIVALTGRTSYVAYRRPHGSMILKSQGRQDGAWWGQEEGHSRTNKWHLQKYEGTRECYMSKEYQADVTGGGWHGGEGVKRDETGEAEEPGHVTQDLVCDAKEFGPCLDGSGKPRKVIFLKGCFVCKAQGRPLLGKPSRRC